MKTLFFLSFLMLLLGCVVERPRPRVIEERPIIVEPAKPEPRHEKPIIEVRPPVIIVEPHR